MRHPVPLARPAARWLAALAWLVPLALLGAAWLPPNEPLPLPVRLLFTGLAAGLAALFAWLPGRLGYALTEGGLELRRASGTFVWPYRELRVGATTAELGVKQAGVNVPGYYSGAFAWSGGGPGTVLALASSPRGGVLVTYRGQRYFLTPADPDAFLRELRARGVTEEGPPGTPGSRPGWG